MSKLVLIDGNSIINRAFYGVPLLTNSEGIHTNAVYGFLNILFSILSEENADYLCVAFDVHAPTFRHKMFEAYKGTRKGMPDELREQVPILKELLQAMKIKTVELPGYEADDILGTLARRGEEKGMDVTLVSGDRDLLQIATDKTLIRIPKTKGGKTTIENYHTQDVIEAYSLEPLQIIELKALMGDSSDNIPGVPKIGEKTATSLLIEYGNIENLKEHIGDITKKSIRESLEANFDMAVMSKKLATIEVNAPLSVDFEELKYESPYTLEAYNIVKRLNFKNMLSRFEDDIKAADTSILDKCHKIVDFVEAVELLERINNYKKAFFYYAGETVGFGKNKKSCSIGLTLCFSSEEIYFIPVCGMITEGFLTDAFCKAVLDSNDTRFITFNLKAQLKFLKSLSDCKIMDKIDDLLIAAYLNNPLKSDYKVEDVASEYKGIIIKNREEAFGKLSLFDAYESKEDAVLEYVCNYVFACCASYEMVMSRLSELEMDKLYRDIEMPLIACLNNIEDAGVLVKPETLTEMSQSLQSELIELEGLIKQEAGEDFNINSPSQLGVILFEKMGIKGGKKTKTGYSTAADVLEKLAPDYPFVSDILKYRALSKLKSTYADGLMPFIDEDNRIRSTFNQTITATGRISSQDPNLQNIPVRMEQGRLIRKAFVPAKDCVFIDADYSQIELRIMAHLSGDEKLIDAFNNGDDIHAITASKVFNTPITEVTPTMRRNAKAVNFGIIYGISSFGLGQDLNISRKEAKEYIDQYFETFPKVKEFLDKQVSDAKSLGYVKTVYGRRRPLPEINSSNFMQRSFGERVAMNAPIQGCAADIMKIAMIAVDNRLKKENLKSRVVLQVHDELMIEAPLNEAEKVKGLLEEEMMNAAKLSVKLIAQSSEGTSWYEAK